MQLFFHNDSDHLSYYLKPEGDVTAVMPDQEPTFSLRFIQSFVGPQVEVACVTPEGYALVRNGGAQVQGFPVNKIASSVLSDCTGRSEVIRGRAFLIHPDHFDPRLVPAA